MEQADRGLMSGADDRMTSTWQQIIDGPLTEWAKHPGEIDADDVVWPTEAAVEKATAIAILCRDTQRWPPPQRTVPNGEGGIVFERHFGPHVFETIEVDTDGGVEFVRFKDHRFQFRRTLHWC